MVISFSNDKVFNFLIKRGQVYTFRKEWRHCTGQNWMNRKRGGKKIADVYIEEIAMVNLWVHAGDLQGWIAESGFKNVQEWCMAIKALNHNKLPEAGYIYRVKLLKSNHT